MKYVTYKHFNTKTLEHYRPQMRPETYVNILFTGKV